MALHRLLPARLRSRRGLLVLALLLGGVGLAVGVGGTVAVHYTETTAFCSSCHAMQPEVRAHEASVHKDVACAECHVRPGVSGWVQAKVKGTQQLLDVLSGSVPRPVPVPDHADLPATQDTCVRCHSLDTLTRAGSRPWLVVRTQFDTDQANTREHVAVALRPDGETAGAGGLGGPHGHVAQRVTYVSPDRLAQTIDLVEVTLPDGSTRQYARRSQVAEARDVRADLARLQREGPTRVMDCLDCHNRVGHAPTSPARQVDDLLASGRIDPTLPFIKRDAVALLTADYPSQQAADRAIGALAGRLRTAYPLLVRHKAAAVDQAVQELRTTYALVATPDMRVRATTYADDFGHQTAPGCFRCHDGAHVQVVDGKATTRTIPSTCATCHAVPQLGTAVDSYLADGRPSSHGAARWAVTHRTLAPGADPTGTSCGACHTRSFCVSCHRTGAVKVRHSDILRTHPAQVASLGAGSCAACHRPTFCVTCHSRSAPPRERRDPGGTT